MAGIKDYVLEKYGGNIAGDIAGEKRKDARGLAHSKPSNIGDRSRTQQKVSATREPESLNPKRVRQGNAINKEIERFLKRQIGKKLAKMQTICGPQRKKDPDFTPKPLFLLEPGKRIELSTY